MEMKNFGLTDTLYDISWQVTEKEYRQGEGISYSTLSRFNREGFDKLDSLFDPISGPHLTFGSLVDTILTGTKEELEENYMVAVFPSVKPQHLTLVEYLFDNYSDKYDNLDSIPDKDIINSTEVVKFNTHWLPKTRVKSIKEEASEYYNLKHLAQGKEIVDQEMYNDAVESAHILKTNETTKWYFQENNPFDKSIERFYQLKFKGTYNDIPIRCMADLIIVDHENKVVRPFDLKTSGKPEWTFPQSFIYWGYWIQAQLYWYIIRQNMDNHPLYKDYDLADYEFIIISNQTKVPLIWVYTDTQLEEDVYYGPNNRYFCRNWRGLLEELHYYLKVKPNTPISISSKNDVIKFLNKEY